MYTILVPLDGSDLSERAAGLGSMLASALGGTLELVSVLEEPILLDLMPTLILPDRLAAERYLSSVAARIPACIPVRETVLRGAPVDEVLSLAEQRPETIIAMSTHGRGGIGRMMFGSVADKIMRGANCPVALVRGTEQITTWRSRKLLVPLDGSELAEGALPLARALATSADGEIHLLRVTPSFWNAPYISYGPDAVYLNHNQISELTDQTQDDSRSYLDRIATELRSAGARVNWEVRVGRPADEIMRVADTVEPDLVILSSHGRGGVRRWALGSVADEILHLGAMPVVVVPRSMTAGPPLEVAEPAAMQA